MPARLQPLYFFAMLTLVLDQLSKWLVVNFIPAGGEIVVIPGFFNLVHVYNRGSAFGFLNQSDGDWPRYFFIAASLLTVLIIIHMVKTAKDRSWTMLSGLGLILGGAFGNLIDRVRLGMVIDFLDFYLGTWRWPAFNIADSGITIGAALLIISFYRTKN